MLCHHKNIAGWTLTSMSVRDAPYFPTPSTIMDCSGKIWRFKFYSNAVSCSLDIAQQCKVHFNINVRNWFFLTHVNLKLITLMYTLTVHSDFHRFASADVCQCLSFAWLPASRAQIFVAHKYSQRAKLLWKTSIGRRRPMHNDEVWTHHYRQRMLITF